MMGSKPRTMIVILACLLLLMFSAESRNTARLLLQENPHDMEVFVSSSEQTALYHAEGDQGLEEDTKSSAVHENFPNRSKTHSFSQDDRSTQPTPSGPSPGHNSVPSP
ncbi:unnamed protein product [Sphagnum jensenii]|uniref:Uncharacterized protein n=1 Tax=Sphagnum jensenii TaxID=128206 RepID=A0ABP1AKS3_9BRYO